jgi:hypothetical protein
MTPEEVESNGAGLNMQSGRQFDAEAGACVHNKLFGKAVYTRG